MNAQTFLLLMMAKNMSVGSRIFCFRRVFKRCEIT